MYYLASMSNGLGIALSGGGARGIAHIGVLHALEAHGVSPDFVSGASAGAIVGACYAAGLPTEEILDMFKRSSLRKLFKISYPDVGLSNNEYIEEVLAKHIQHDAFEHLKKSLFISVTNLNKGTYEIIEQGPLFQAVATSASIPVLFQARKMGDALYVDGGLLNNLPVEPLAERCRHILGVNVNPIEPTEELDNLFDIAYRTFDLAMWSNVQARLAYCDLVLEPKTTDFGMFDAKEADKLFDLGYRTTMEHMDDVQRLLGRSPLIKVFIPPRRDPPSTEDRLRPPGWKRWWTRVRGKLQRWLFHFKRLFR